MDRIDELTAEYRRLLHSFEYAYAMGHPQTIGARDPRLDRVVARVDELREELAALRERERDEPSAPGA